MKRFPHPDVSSLTQTPTPAQLTRGVRRAEMDRHEVSFAATVGKAGHPDEGKH